MHFSKLGRLAEAQAAQLLDALLVQENHAVSHAPGTIRGLHFQIGDAAQAKLIRCPCGSIFDVAVDLRRGSPTFGRHTGIVLSAENWKAHGYCTLEPDTEVTYKVTAYYDPASERGLAWDDSVIGIVWPVRPDQAIVTERDRTSPRLAELPDFFSFGD
jgi:dTDP-4-dehydrorhamnose 3,5-epimerase